MAQAPTLFGTRARYRLFTALKYLTYALLTLNVYLFLQEELLALQHTFRGNVAAGQLIQIFSATIDTAAWVILLILFELETSVLDDRRIKGGVKWALHGTRGLCYIGVVYAFTGYYSELDTLRSARYLAWTDVINSGTWILVVVTLEIEVRLQLYGRLTGRVLAGGKAVKAVLYTILFAERKVQ